eukprot:14186994-Heterocapsa_arctica.AAC.1
MLAFRAVTGLGQAQGQALGREWGLALDMLGAARGRGIEPDIMTYSASISSCAKGGAWLQAIQSP